MENHYTLLNSAKRILKPATPLFQWIKKRYAIYEKTIVQNNYNKWASQNEELCFVEQILEEKPLMSIVVPAYNTVHRYLLEMVYSVINQHYDNWELILVNASTKTRSKRQINACSKIDTRIKIISVDKNKGISGNTNIGIKYATGEYIVFLDHDDRLHPCALHSVASNLQESNADILYTDEDKVNHKSNFFFDPHLKSKWSPDLLRNVNYFNHLTTINSQYVRGVKGLRKSVEGAQDYDLILRVIDKYSPSIKHIPKVLYHWRATAFSTAKSIQNKKYIFNAGTKSIQEHLKRNNIEAIVDSINNRPGFYKITYKSPNTLSIAIGVVEGRLQKLCAQWLDELFLSVNTQKIELFIGDWYREYADRHSFRKIHLIKKSKNYWNDISKSITSEVIIIFQEAALPKSKKGLLELSGIAAQKHCLVASPLIVDDKNIIIDAGLVEADFGLQSLLVGYKLGDNTFFGSTEWNRNIKAPTLNIFATRKDNFKQLVKAKTDLIINQKDLKNINSRTNSELYTMWAHAAFEYKGPLSLEKYSRDNYFNPQTTQASLPMKMQVLKGDFDEEKKL